MKRFCCKAAVDRCTCSIHGEKQQILEVPDIYFLKMKIKIKIVKRVQKFISSTVFAVFLFCIRRQLPQVLSAWYANGTASHGFGRSRKTASARLLSPNPSWHTSRCWHVITSQSAWSRNSWFANLARSSWKSNVYKWPVGAIVRAIACDNDPDPVPASTTCDKKSDLIKRTNKRKNERAYLASRLQIQHWTDQTDVGRVQNLSSMRQTQRPEFGRRWQHDHWSFGTLISRPERTSDQFVMTNCTELDLRYLTSLHLQRLNVFDAGI